MERLTQKTDYCTAFCRMEDRKECAYWTGCVELKCGDARIYDRLAAYEDTGLEPEEVEVMRETKADAQFMLTELCRLCDYDRLEELAKADKEGQLVVLPCKVGTTVYSTRWWDEVPETCTDSKGRKFQRIAMKHKVTKEEFRPFGPDYIKFGEEVFLTREEAERALEGGQTT